MLHLHRITTLFCLSIPMFACDFDEHPVGLDEFEALDDVREALDAGDDERVVPRDAPDEERAAASAGRHCIVEATAVPFGVDPTTVRVADKPMTCFPRFSDAILAITGERIADDVTPETYEPGDQISNASGVQRASYILGVEYDKLNFGAPSLTVLGSGTCLTASWNLNKFSDTWWDDRISAAKAYSGCKHAYHYEHTNLGGAVKDCGTGCAYIGAAMDNRTSSIRFTK